MLGFLLALYGFSIFGYITATLASFFVGRDAEEADAPVAGSADVAQLETEVHRLRDAVAALTLVLNKQLIQAKQNDA